MYVSCAHFLANIIKHTLASASDSASRAHTAAFRLNTQVDMLIIEPLTPNFAKHIKPPDVLASDLTR